MELHNRDVMFHHVRGDISTYIERRWDASVRPAPMEIGSQEEDEAEQEEDTFYTNNSRFGVRGASTHMAWTTEIGCTWRGTLVGKSRGTPMWPRSKDLGEMDLPEGKGAYNSGKSLW